MYRQKFEMSDKRLMTAVNALADTAAELDLTLEEFRLAGEIAGNMLIGTVEREIRVAEVQTRAEAAKRTGSQACEA